MGLDLDACWNQCKGKAAEEESPAPGVPLRGCDAGSGMLHEIQGSFMAAWHSPEGARLTSAWCRVLSLGKGSSRHSGSMGSSPAAASRQPVRREVQDQAHSRAATCAR